MSEPFYILEERYELGEKITELERGILLLRQSGSTEIAFSAAAELAQLRARLELVQGAVRKARGQLRATQRNWDEDCLFRCDEILTAVLEDK